MPRQQDYYRRNVAPAENRVYVIVSDGVNARLRKKQHSTVTEDYRDIQTVEDLVMPPHAPRVEPQPAENAPQTEETKQP